MFYMCCVCTTGYRAANANDPSVSTITEKAPMPSGTFSWLKAPVSAFTFKTLLRHYAKQAPKDNE